MGRHLGPRVSRADHHEGTQRIPLGLILGRVGQLELLDQVVPQEHRLRDAPEAVCVLRDPWDRQQLVHTPGRDDQPVVAEFAPLTRWVDVLDLAPVKIEPVDLAEDEPGSGERVGQRDGQPARLENARGHLG
jgi:hypothetical protein